MSEKSSKKNDLWSAWQFFAHDLFDFVFNNLKKEKKQFTTILGHPYFVNSYSIRHDKDWWEQLTDIVISMSLISTDTQTSTPITFDIFQEIKTYQNWSTEKKIEDNLFSFINKKKEIIYWSPYVVFRILDSSWIQSQTLDSMLLHPNFPKYFFEINLSNLPIQRDELISHLKDLEKILLWRKKVTEEERKEIKVKNDNLLVQKDLIQLSNHIIAHITNSFSTYENNPQYLELILKNLDLSSNEILQSDISINTNNGFELIDNEKKTVFDNDLNRAHKLSTQYAFNKYKFLSRPIVAEKVEKIEKDISELTINRLEEKDVMTSINKFSDNIESELTKLEKIKNDPVYKYVVWDTDKKEWLFYGYWAEWKSKLQYINNGIKFISKLNKNDS